MKTIPSLSQYLLVAAGALAVVAAGAGCAHARDGARTLHRVEAYGEVVPAGWTIVKPVLTNSPSGNALADYSVVAPGGTNMPGFFTGLVQRPMRFLAYREEWLDSSAGGGTFVFTDPEATALAFGRTNQTALGGNRSVTVGSLKSTITTNAVSAIGAGGTAIGNVISAAAQAVK